MQQTNVPEMSLSTHTIKRLPKIQQGLREGLNRTQIGTECGVSEKTIDRDMQSWVQSGLFEIWLKTEFVQLYYHEKLANPTEAFKEISRIVGRMVTQKKEISVDETVTETHYNFNYSEEDKTAILNAYRIINKTNSSTTKPTSLH